MTLQTLYYARLTFAFRLSCYLCCSSKCKTAHMQEDDGFLCTYLQKHGEKSYQSNHSKQYAKERRPLPDNFFICFCEDLKFTEMKRVSRSWQTLRITDHIKRGDGVGSPPQWSRWRWCWTPAAWLRWSRHRWFLPKYTATQKCWNASL